MKNLTFLLFLILCFPAFCQEKKYPLGNRPPTPEEQAYLDEHVVEVKYIAPNDLAIARSLTEAMSAGAPWPQTLGLPSLVDNSALKYFPPTGNQNGLYACAAWAAAYYYSSYTQAKDNDWDIRDGNPDKLTSPLFIFNLTNGNQNVATNFGYSVAKQCEIGVCSLSLMPGNTDYTSWPSEAAWVDALRNRMRTPYMVNANTQETLNAIKQHLANGNVCTSHFWVHDNFWSYPNDTNGINNQVYYAFVGGIAGEHGSTLVGYSDTKSYVDYRDGKTYSGAFLCANSWGSWGLYNTTGTGNRCFYWVAYRMFLESTFGPDCYFNSDRPHYKPKLYALTGINHPDRGQLTHSGGIGPTGAPLYTSPEALKFDSRGDAELTDVKRVAVDLTDGLANLQNGASNTIFVKTKNAATSLYNASVTSADFYVDLDGTGTYSVLHSSDPPMTITPGSTVFSTVQLALPASKNVYVDDSNVSGPWDGTSEHPYLTIQAGVDAATFGDSVVVRDGTYIGAGNKEISPNGKHIVVKSEDGAAGTVIDCQNSGRAFYIHTQETAETIIDGFTIIRGNETEENGGGGMLIWESSPVIKNCVLTGNTSSKYGGGVACRRFSEPVIMNCLITGNSAPEGGGIAAGNGKVTIKNCTLTGNYASIRGGGIYFFWGNTGTITDTILWGDNSPLGVEIAMSADSNPSAVTVTYSDVQSGQSGVEIMDGCTLTWGSGNIDSNPLFVTGPCGDYYLSQISSGQDVNSPCMDAGSASATSLGLGGKTTRTNNVPDADIVDIGYHYNAGLYVYSMEASGGNVILRWNAKSGVSYTVQWSEDMVIWNDVPVGEASEWTDTDTGRFAEKIYRIVE